MSVNAKTKDNAECEWFDALDTLQGESILSLETFAKACWYLRFRSWVLSFILVLSAYLEAFTCTHLQLSGLHII